MLQLNSTKTLHNGIEMPRFGLGVYKMTDRDEAIEAMVTALNAGYLAIDTASFYNNEAEVGEAVRASSVSRENIFITTKVWNTDQGYDETLRAFEKSLTAMKLDYLDLYMTHWPKPDAFQETYRAIERLYDEKLIRATGVANHEIHHLETLAAKANVKPMVNQIECHPYLIQDELQRYCDNEKIAVTAWSPLGRGQILNDATIVEIGKGYNKSAAQVILRWHLQKDRLVIPKSVTPSRIIENATIFDFALTEADMRKIDALDRNYRTGNHPDTFPYDDPKYTR